MQLLDQALQVLQERVAFGLAPADEALEVGGSALERAPAGRGMDANRRVDALEFLLGEAVAVPKAQALLRRKLLVPRPDILA